MNENNHKHTHNHDQDLNGVKGSNLIITMVLNFIITAAEVIGGLYAGSLSLISDALHNFSDGLSLIVSYFAIKISQKSSDEKRTFGYKRATILAAVMNSTVLILISFFLFREAYIKFVKPEEINGTVVIWVALIGLAANALGAYLLHQGSDKDMNLKSAYLHLLSDTLSSIGVVTGGILILYFKIYWIDPLLTVLIGVYVLKESYKILKDAVNILMQGIPENIDINKIVKELSENEKIKNIHHIHIWQLDQNTMIFEAHVNVKEDIYVSETSEIRQEIEHKLRKHFGINHVTIQFEYNCCENTGIINKN